MAYLKDFKNNDLIINLEDNYYLTKLYHKSNKNKGAMVAQQYFVPKKKNDCTFSFILSNDFSSGKWISLENFLSEAEFVGRKCGVNLTELETNIMLFKTKQCVMVYNTQHKRYYFYAGNGNNLMKTWLKGETVIENTPENKEKVLEKFYADVEKDFTIDADIIKRININKKDAEEYLTSDVRKIDRDADLVEYYIALLELTNDVIKRVNTNNPKVLSRLKSGQTIQSKATKKTEKQNLTLTN